MSQLTDTFAELKVLGIEPDRVSYIELGPSGLRIDIRAPLAAPLAVAENLEPIDRSAEDDADWYAAAEGYVSK